MAAQIELAQVVNHCKQLPQYKDALPIITFLQEWGADHAAAAEVVQAIKEIREYFRLQQPSQQESESRKRLEVIETPEQPELRFFRQVSPQITPQFKEALRDCLAKIDKTGKKEWFCIYAAWRYLQNEREVDGGYVDFFTDIDALFPGLLKDIRTDLKGNRRLKPYCDMLSYEYKLWAVDNGKLPDMKEWRHSSWAMKYQNSKAAILRMQDLISQFYMAFSQTLNQK